MNLLQDLNLVSVSDAAQAPSARRKRRLIFAAVASLLIVLWVWYGFSGSSDGLIAAISWTILSVLILGSELVARYR